MLIRQTKHFSCVIHRIVVTVQPPAPLSALEEVQSSDNSPLSSLDAYPVMKAEPSPFSSRPVMFETEEVGHDCTLYASICCKYTKGKSLLR